MSCSFLKRKVITLRNLVFNFFKNTSRFYALRDSSREPQSLTSHLKYRPKCSPHLPGIHSPGTLLQPTGRSQGQKHSQGVQKIRTSRVTTRQSLVGLAASRTTGGWKKSNFLGTPSAVLCWKRYRLSHTCYNGNLGPQITRHI